MVRIRFSALACALLSLSACGGASKATPVGEDPVSSKAPKSARVAAAQRASEAEGGHGAQAVASTGGAPGANGAAAVAPEVPGYEPTPVRAAVVA